MTFIHLHVASCFSSHYGTATPQELAAAAAAAGAPALALTDRNGIYGAVQHIGACRDHDLAPILGADLAVHGHGRVTVLAHGSRKGYAALCQAVSAAHEGTSASSSGPEPALSRERLAQLSRTSTTEAPCCLSCWAQSPISECWRPGGDTAQPAPLCGNGVSFLEPLYM